MISLTPVAKRTGKDDEVQLDVMYEGKSLRQYKFVPATEYFQNQLYREFILGVQVGIDLAKEKLQNAHKERNR